ncbi:GntR family transcriptional regulator [Devosia sp. MC1541]|uniref:GntR family transcriptional regulator n=1 Tax=Devosia sp. MC1541 TaxID=2725264 RepID=UPI0024A6C784|nr:GntR family transcriptional regulator [Devosia sp. MC1541]
MRTIEISSQVDSRPTAPGKRSDAIYAVLHDHLTRGIFSQGLVLTESAIARAFGVSRSPAAAALEKLAQDGLICSFDGRGFLVGSTTNIPLRLDLFEAGLSLEADKLDEMQQRGWRDRLYPLVERDVAASMAYGPFQIVGTSLAETFGVSRTVAHEVLTRLERVGLVQQGNNGRWYVPRLTVRDVEEHYEVRSVLEPLALVQGARSLEKEDIKVRLDRARSLVARGTASSEAEIVLLENDLHRDIVLACSNAQFRQIIERSQLPLIATHLTFERYLNDEEILPSAEQHLKILEALYKGDDATAAKEMLHHLQAALVSTVKVLEASVTTPTSRIPSYLIQPQQG